MTLRDKHVKNPLEATYPTSSKVYSNPLPALDVVSRKEWLLVDPQRIQSQEERNDFVQSLIQLISFSSAPTLFQLGADDNQTDLLTTEKEITSLDMNAPNGGIALVCKNNADILHACACIQSLQGYGTSFKANKSGILVSSVDGSEITNEESSMLDHQKSTPQNYALVIPFESGLWKTASFLFTDDASI